MDTNIYWDGILEKIDDINKVIINGKEFTHNLPKNKGTWVKRFGCGESTWMCSNCHITQTVTTFNSKPQFKYCPYCGVEMTVQEESKKPITYSTIITVTYSAKYPRIYREKDIETLEYVREGFITNIKGLIIRDHIEASASTWADGSVKCVIYLNDLSIGEYDTIKEKFSPPSWIFKHDLCNLTLKGMTMEVERFENN